MYERLLLPGLRDSKANVLLLGPRQVGKSTLLRQLGPDLTLNLASPATFREYVTRPERLEEELRAAPRATKVVMLEEVQRVPRLLDVVQVLTDEMPGRFRFLLSGSSARKLKAGQANLLPGRVHVHHLAPLVAQELGRDYDVERAMAHGNLPAAWTQSPRERATMLRSYVDSYLREEIQAEALVRDVGGYARLLEHFAAVSGKVVNLSALCRDAGIAYETARRYVEILEDTLVAFRVPAWRGSDRASLIAHPKLFLFDAGVRNALLRRPLDRALDDDRGVLLEHVVAMEIHARLGEPWPEARLLHYRARGGAEVDFVIEAGRELWAIEVKASRDAGTARLLGFRSLSEHVKRVSRRIVVFLGPRARTADGIEYLPLERFLDELPG